MPQHVMCFFCATRNDEKYISLFLSNYVLVLLLHPIQILWRPESELGGIRKFRQLVPLLTNRDISLIRTTTFFRIVDTCLSCEDTARQSCAMVPNW